MFRRLLTGLGALIDLAVHHPHTIHMDGELQIGRTDKAFRPVDSEKITINLGFVDLGHIDLLVREGLYSNRTDFIRTAIRNQLERQGDIARQITTRRQLTLGLCHYGTRELEAVRAAGEMLDIRVLGLATIAADVTPELALATIGSLTVLGAFHASPAVKAALADRIT